MSLKSSLTAMIAAGVATAAMPLERPVAGMAPPGDAAPVAERPGEPGVAAVRAATERFRDVRAALAEGYVRDPLDLCDTAEMMGRPPEVGAMGIHYFRADLLGISSPPAPRVTGTGVHIDFRRPSILIYEPQADGSLELVAVENLVFAEAWAKAGHSGFVVREPMAVMSGRPRTSAGKGATVRPLGRPDLAACNALYERIHGFDRAHDLEGAIRLRNPFLCEREGRIRAYVTAPALWLASHAVAESEEDMQALILGVAAATGEPLSFLLPLRQAGLFRWCLREGLKPTKPMTLMTIGEYREPGGSYFPSVFY